MAKRRRSRNARNGRAADSRGAAVESALPRPAIAAILIVFSLAFAASEFFSYTHLSAAFDEPGHLAAGYAALTRSDYRLDPPLARLWSALPLLGTGVNRQALSAMNAMAPEALAFNGPFEIARRFLYGDNDADRLLYGPAS